MQYYLSHTLERRLNESLYHSMHFPSKAARIGGYHYDLLHIDELLARSPERYLRWQVSYLRSPEQGAQSAYYREYLLPMFGVTQATSQLNHLHDLYTSIQRNGLRRCVHVADISMLNLGFRYYRFDGCRRACCCKVLGIVYVPTLIFHIGFDEV